MIAVLLILATVAAVLVLRPKGGKHATTVSASPAGWVIGPIVKGKNYSQGMPAAPTLQGKGWTIEFPATGGVDAVQNFNPPKLGPSVSVHYTVTGGGFLAAGESNVPGRVGVCIQRVGDDWSGKGVYQQFRLYGTSRPLLVAGTGQFTASEWTDVQGKPASAEQVATVLANLSNVAIVFGGSFASHGVYATQPSQFTLIEIN